MDTAAFEASNKARDTEARTECDNGAEQCALDCLGGFLFRLRR